MRELCGVGGPPGPVVWHWLWTVMHVCSMRMTYNIGYNHALDMHVFVTIGHDALGIHASAAHLTCVRHCERATSMHGACIALVGMHRACNVQPCI